MVLSVVQGGFNTGLGSTLQAILKYTASSLKTRARTAEQVRPLRHGWLRQHRREGAQGARRGQRASAKGAEALVVDRFSVNFHSNQRFSMKLD